MLSCLNRAVVSPSLTPSEQHHAENRDVSQPNLPIVHCAHTQRLVYSVKRPFEWLTEQQGMLLKGFSLQVLSRAFHHNRAQLRQGAGDGGMCCTFPLLAPTLPDSFFAFPFTPLLLLLSPPLL